MSAADDAGAPRGGRRRIDRATDSTVVDRLADMPTAEVRLLRDECREEEARLSYLRRLLHARLDIARAEAARRGGEGEDLLDKLPEILAGDARPSGTARALSLYEPGPHEGRRAEDRLLDDAALTRLPELDDTSLAGVVAQLEGTEREVSEQRRAVLTNLDALQAELVARYRDGRADIGEVLAAGGRSAVAGADDEAEAGDAGQSDAADAGSDESEAGPR